MNTEWQIWAYRPAWVFNIWMEQMPALRLGQSRLQHTVVCEGPNKGKYLLVYFDNQPKPMFWTLLDQPEANF